MWLYPGQLCSWTDRAIHAAVTIGMRVAQLILERIITPEIVEVHI